MLNQNPEQISRDKIDTQLIAAGWLVQSKSEMNLAAGLGRGTAVGHEATARMGSAVACGLCSFY